MGSISHNPIEPFVEAQGVLILDGGLATTLESRGHDLNDPLWSARLLLEEPDAIRQVHLDFLAAGADCIVTSTYQASLAGFESRGRSASEAADLLRLSVDLATQARDLFWQESTNRQGRLRPLVAASVGPYGAFLADGSEYTGDYDLDEGGLLAFHQTRWHILAETNADLLACETIPSQVEGKVLRDLLGETPRRGAWMSFTCRDARHLSDGSLLSAVAGACDNEAGIVAVGINCTSPEWIPSLLGEARKGTRKPLFVYPNSGEHYDAVDKSWKAGEATGRWQTGPSEWARQGAVGIGGCCRIAPEGIARLRQQLLPRANSDSP